MLSVIGQLTPVACAAETPTITWRNPDGIPYGTPLSATQLNATANVPGTFVYTPPAGTVLNAGTYTLHVNFTPTDTTSYSTASKDVTLKINKWTATISWPNPAGIIYGTPLSSLQLNATASVPCRSNPVILPMESPVSSMEVTSPETAQAS